MAVRRLAEQQPETFALTPANAAWAEAKMRDYPEGRQASAVIPILWKVQEQHGWVPEPAIRLVADMLAMPYIRVFEVATFYTMFQLKPVGSVAHVGVCGTTPCMLRGAPELVDLCRSRIAPHPFELSADGRFSWEEVECAGACVNAPMVQIGADTYEDLTAESFSGLLDALERGAPPAPGPQSSRRASEPITGPTTLTSPRKDVHPKMPAAAPDAAPDAGVDPRSPAAANQDRGRPSSERSEVEAMRTTNAPPTDPHPVAPEPKTDGQIATGPDAPEKQQSATTTGDVPTAEPAPPNAAEARGADRVTTDGPAPTGPGDVVLTSEAAADPATKAAADRAAPGADLAQTPPSEEDADAAASGEAGTAAADATSTGTTVAKAGASEGETAPAQAAAPEGRAAATATTTAAPDAGTREAAGGEATAARPAEGTPGARPPARERGEGGEPDELTRISGVGRKTAETLNGLGIWRYEQIAAWNEAETAWVSAHLGFKGRIDRERWVDQAKALAGKQGA